MIKNEHSLLNTIYQKDNFEAGYSLVSEVSPLTLHDTGESIVISNEGGENNRFFLELTYSEIHSISILKDHKKSYRLRINFIITILSIALCILIEGSLTSNSDPNFAFDLFFGIIIGVLVSSVFPISESLLSISFGENGESKMLMSFKGTKDEIRLINTMSNNNKRSRIDSLRG